MPLLSLWMVTIIGFFGTPAAYVSFTGNRDAFYVHPTPQMWTASKLLRQLCNNSGFGAVSTNGSKSDLKYAVGHVYWEDTESRHHETCQVTNRKDGSLVEEQLNGFSNVVTNSGGAVIGGSCGGTGGLIFFCVLIYFLYKWLKDDTSVHPTNQNGASCPPPPYDHVVAIGECADPCTFMSKPSTC